MLIFAPLKVFVCAAAYLLANGMSAVGLVTMKRLVAFFIGGENNLSLQFDLHIGGDNWPARAFWHQPFGVDARLTYSPEFS